MLSFSSRGVLDEILNLIESVSEGSPSYPCYCIVENKYSLLSTSGTEISQSNPFISNNISVVAVVVVLLFYVDGKHLRSCRDGQLT